MNDEVEILMTADRYVVGVGFKASGERVTLDRESAEQLVRNGWAQLPAKTVTVKPLLEE